MNKTIILSLSIFLAACAVPQIDQTAAHFSEDKFHVDLNDCRGGNLAEASVKSLGVAALGSLWGVAHGLPSGAIHGDGLEGAAIGAAVGAVVGFGMGAADAIENHNSEISGCLRGKGYTLASKD